MQQHLAFVDANFTSLEAVARAKEHGCRTTFVGTSAFRKYPDNPRNREILASVDHLTYLDVPLSPQNIQAALVEAQQYAPIDAVLGLQEMTIHHVATVAESMQLLFTPIDAIRLCRDKAAVRRKLDEHGLPNIGHAEVVSLDDALAAARRIGYPVMLKPRSGAASLLVYKCVDEPALRQAWQRGDEESARLVASLRDAMSSGRIVEAYLEGPMVSVEIGVQGGESRIYMISGRRRCDADEMLDYGIDMPAWLTPPQWSACETYARDICRILGLDHGIFHLEMIVTPGGPVLVEANGRLMGGNLPLVYQNLTGNCIYDDLFRYFVRQPLGDMPDPRAFGQSSSIRLEAASEGVWRAASPAELIGPGDASMRVIAADALLSPGQPVKAGYILARVQCFSPDVDELASRVDALMKRIQDLGGITLLR